MKNTFSLRGATAADIDDVVHIHNAAFTGFFLTLLGSEFLKVMYSSFLESKSGVFVVLEHAGRVQGFAVGYANNTANDRVLALKYALQFAVAILPVFLLNPIRVSRRIISQFFAGGSYPGVAVDSAVLRSIAVHPSLLGTGAALELLQCYEVNAKSKGAHCVTLTTDKLNNSRAVTFYTKAGYAEAGLFKQGNGRELIVFTKKMNQ